MSSKGVHNFNINVNIDYDVESDRFRSAFLEHPLSICFKVTEKCNYACPHCIGLGSPKAPYGLTTEQLKYILDDIKASGTNRVGITGGEPYMREDLHELLEHSVKIGLETVMTTNGSLMTKEKAAYLKDLGVFTEISIDGPKEINDKVRWPGSYEIAVNALKLLREAGVNARINTVIQDSNIDVVDYMIDLCKELDVKNQYFLIVSAQGRGNIHKNKMVSIEEEEALRKKILKLRLSSEEIGLHVKVLDYKKYAYGSLLVDYNGDFIAQCWDGGKRKRVGNVLERTIAEMWKETESFDHMTHLIKYLRHPMLYR